jgi:hypothetical protein
MTTFEILEAIKGNGHQLSCPFKWLQQAMYARKSSLGESAAFITGAIISRILEADTAKDLFF